MYLRLGPGFTCHLLAFRSTNFFPFASFQWLCWGAMSRCVVVVVVVVGVVVQMLVVGCFIIGCFFLERSGLVSMYRRTTRVCYVRSVFVLEAALLGRVKSQLNSICLVNSAGSASPPICTLTGSVSVHKLFGCCFMCKWACPACLANTLSLQRNVFPQCILHLH